MKILLIKILFSFCINNLDIIIIIKIYTFQQINKNRNWFITTASNSNSNTNINSKIYQQSLPAWENWIMVFQLLLLLRWFSLMAVCCSMYLPHMYPYMQNEVEHHAQLYIWTKINNYWLDKTYRQLLLCLYSFPSNSVSGLKFTESSSGYLQVCISLRMPLLLLSLKMMML